MNRTTVKLLVGALALATAATFAAERIDIVTEGGAGKHWNAPLNPLPPAYPSTVAENDSVCVGVGYAIEKDGSTSGFMVLKSWSKTHGSGDDAAPAIDPFARNALAAVQQWKFTPVTAGKERKIYTATTFAFDRDAAADAGAIKGHCKVSNLSAFLQKAQAEAYKTGNLNKGVEDRDRQNGQVIHGPGEVR
jgi:hypothetical protein